MNLKPSSTIAMGDLFSEWRKLVELAALEAYTALGRASVERYADPHAWARDAAQARTLFVELQEASGLLTKDSFWSGLSELGDPSTLFPKLDKDQVLELAELRECRGWLTASEIWLEFPKDELRGEFIRKALARLPDPRDPLRVLRKVITPEGEISETASPKLHQLSAEVRSLQRSIEVALERVLRNLSAKGILQETFSDVREGRYVVPVKMSHRNEIEGIPFETSVSRQTVFVEPKELAVLNAQLRQKQAELAQEVFEVLRSTSAALKPYAAEISLAVETLSHWDAVQARARVGLHYGGKAVAISARSEFSLKQMAHPLLYWSFPSERVIRNDVELGNPHQVLLITGPNTGGKTVLLKALGLSAICARTGFPFPATGQPEVPFCEKVFADLGDSQSIERQLSSFSGHLEVYRRVLEEMSPASLILFDELSTATDPEEGMALGRAILETLMDTGAWVVTTTHDPNLKAWAFQDRRVMSASMAFSDESQAPTYKLQFGVPGRSRALETAERLGIPRAVLDRARGFLSEGHRAFEKHLGDLDRAVREAADLRREAAKLHEKARALQEEWEAKSGASLETLLDKTRARLKKVVEQTQDELRGKLKQADEVRLRETITGIFEKAAKGSLQAVKEESPELAGEVEKAATKIGFSPKESFTPAEPLALKAGDWVRVPKWKSQGEVLEVHGQKLKVQLGKMQMSLTLAEVEKIDAPAKPKSAALKVEMNILDTPARQLDLRGKRLDEAMAELEPYLDRAYRAGFLEVTVVTGLGTGAIREAARALMSKLPYIDHFRDGGAGGGGTGATLVTFAQR